MTCLVRAVYTDPLATAADMAAERCAWQGLRCDITGMKRPRPQVMSDCANPGTMSVDA